ncbi:Probable zinc transport system zinc-binding lipoprotein AdcA precursor [Turicibacter sanguinis]|nr:Probable zinc transport system zinc-binding lipoprotein AdcA precursor [Turicibacter sanguinis]
MKKFKGLVFTLMSFVVLLVGCDTDSKMGSVSDKLQIVTTLFPQYDFARVIGGDKVDVTLLLPAGMESHSYEPTPADIIKINKADLFIYTGESMEQWAHSIIQSVDSNEVYVLDVSKNVPLLAPNSTVEDNHDHEGENHDHDAEVEVGHDHSEGDGHNHTYDPHIWASPKNAMIMVNNILEALCEVDSENADYYKDNANAYLAELEELDHELEDVVTNAKRDTIYHGGRFAMQYLTNQYGIHYVSAPFEAEPSAALVAQMIKEIKEQNIPVIYYEELVDPKISQMISDETGAKMLLLHSCHNVSKEDFNNGVTYLSLMKQNMENLKVGLD